MANEHMDPDSVHQHMVSNVDAMLVCAYDSDEKFQHNRLEGAISLSDLESTVDSVPQDQEIIFYCA